MLDQFSQELLDDMLVPTQVAVLALARVAHARQRFFPDGGHLGTMRLDTLLQKMDEKKK